MKRKMEQKEEEPFLEDSQWLPNSHIPEAHDLPELIRNESLPSNISQSLTSRLDTLFPNELVHFTMASFPNSFSQFKPSQEVDFNLKTFSFDSFGHMEPKMDMTAEKDEVDASVVVPVAANNENDVLNIMKCPRPAMNLRPKRNARKPKQDYSFLYGSDEECREEVDDEDKKCSEAVSSNSSTTQPRKKRAYYRKNKHPKEVLEKVEAERLKRKRLKNRELAARSRRKKKEKMDSLENENADLKKQIAILKRQIAGCKCEKQSC